MLKIAVVGAGGTGGYFGGRLCQNARCDVHFLLRPNSSNVAAIRADGLRLLSVKGDHHEAARKCQVATSAAAIGPCDYVIVCVKTYDLEQLAPTLRPLLKEGTAVVPLLNGMDAHTVLGKALGEEHVLGGLCLIIAFLEAPGVVRQTAGSDTQLITFGELRGKCESARVARLKQAFLEVGVAAYVPSDDVGVLNHLWEKFVKIVGFSGVTAVCRAGMGHVLDEPRSRQSARRRSNPWPGCRLPACCLASCTLLTALSSSRVRRIYTQLLHEGVATARAHGGGKLMTDTWLDEQMAQVGRLAKGATSSMQRDLVAGRVSELHEQIGAMCVHAETFAVDVPTTSFVYAALIPQEAAARAEQAPAGGGASPSGAANRATRFVLVAAAAMALALAALPRGRPAVRG